jgi:hypothetical protein
LISLPTKNYRFLLTSNRFVSSNVIDSNEDANHIRSSVVTLIEQSWLNVVGNIPKKVLMSCEKELRIVTSLIVLATFKRIIELEQGNNESIYDVFRAADKNGDGSLTFIEWHEWLGENIDRNFSYSNANKPISTTSGSEKIINSLEQVLTFASGNNKIYIRYISFNTIYNLDTLNIASRVSMSPEYLIVAFIAGSISTGLISKQMFDTLLLRLSPEMRLAK